MTSVASVRWDVIVSSRSDRRAGDSASLSGESPASTSTAASSVFRGAISSLNDFNASACISTSLTRRLTYGLGAPSVHGTLMFLAFKGASRNGCRIRASLLARVADSTSVNDLFLPLRRLQYSEGLVIAGTPLTFTGRPCNAVRGYPVVVAESADIFLREDAIRKLLGFKACIWRREESVGFLEEVKEPYATTQCRGVCVSDQRRGARRRVSGRSRSKGLIDYAKGRLVASTTIP